MTQQELDAIKTRLENSRNGIYQMGHEPNWDIAALVAEVERLWSVELDLGALATWKEQAIASSSVWNVEDEA